ncbi:MAG: DNA polymerase III subunit gamma/tau [Lachnospiraceae bacterium]|nr:DNA polymerase III subunit gamma/tau [Lachnospiraceae bacterium]
MSYQALYRKFRPGTFDEVKGQDAIVETLRNQLRNQRVGHAYLFCGTRGTGKTTIAKIMAKAVNCENPQDGDPCGECRMCKAIAAGASMNVIEMDAASHRGVEDIRQIVEEISYTPAEGNYRVYIIDEVHMLTNEAFNALLKTLEEPPAYVIFILATTEANKIPITVLSRCQRYDFKRIYIDTITDRLKDLMEREGIEAEEKALRYVARMGDGSMRDALSLLEQCIAFNFGQTLTYDATLEVLGAVDQAIFGRMLRCFVEKDVAGALMVLHEVVMQGRELTQFVADLIMHFRSLLLLRCSDDIEDVLDVSSENLAAMKEEAQLIDEADLMRNIRIFSELQGQIRYATMKRVLIEVAIIKVCRPQMETKGDSLLPRIRALEEKLESGQFVAAAMAAGSVQGGAAVANGAAVNPAGMTAEEKEKADQELAKALPEDIKKVVARWGEIRSRAQLPLKSYLQHVTLSVEEDKLMIVVPDGEISDYFTSQDDREREKNRTAEIEKLISDRIGKQVPVVIRVRMANNNNGRGGDPWPDLEKLLNTEVVVEGEDSSPLDD